MHGAHAGVLRALGHKVQAHQEDSQVMTEKKMKIMVPSILVLASLVTVAVPEVGAVVYSKESPAQRLRADIGRQRVEYLKCLTRSALACEKTGVLPGSECVLATSTAAMPADPQGKFPRGCSRVR